MKKIKGIIHTTFNVKRAVGFVWTASRGWALLNAALLVIQGILPIVSIYLLKVLVDSVVGTLGGDSTEAQMVQVYMVLTAVGAVMLLTGLARTVGSLAHKEESRRIADYMHDVIQHKAIEVDLQYYENPAYQDTLHRAQEEATFRPAIIVRALTAILQNTISLLGVAWLLFIFKWQVLILLIFAVLPGMVVRFVFSSKEFLNERNYTQKERQAVYYHYLVVGREMAKEIRLFRLGPTFIERFKKLRSELRNIRYKLDKKNALYSALAHVSTTLLVFFAYFWVARDALLGLVTIGSFVMFYQAFQKGQMFLQSLLEGIARLYENNLFLTNLYEFLDIDSGISAEEAVPIETSADSCKLLIENISFRYPSTEKQVLEKVSMTVEPGQIAALVGKNGSGKTTLVKLICRLYDVERGSIHINDTDISTVDPYALRKKIGVIFQDYPHYNLSVRDNIWFGDIDKTYNSSMVFSAAEQAGAAEMIDNLSNGYETTLGRIFEKGEELSEGQWQKIALSRAFFRDSQMLILDEPTSSMDPRSEYELFRGFRKILAGRTALIISHRMSTIRMADKIFVLDKGRIAESGTHAQLIDADGMYADMFKLQASKYHTAEAL